MENTKLTIAEQQEIRKAILEDMERHLEVKKLGFAGVLPCGRLVDRRIYPDAIPIQENKLLGVPKPQPLK